MLYCGIEGVIFGNEGEEYEPYIYYKGCTIQEKLVETPMFEEFKKQHPNNTKYSKEFTKYIQNHPEMVYKILDKIINE